MIISTAYASETAAGHTSMFQDPTFWVGFAFCMTVVVLIKLAGKQISSGLQARADGISSQLSEAKALREESQQLLESSKKKLANAQQDIDAAIKQAQDRAEEYKKTAQADLEDRLKKKEASAEKRLALAGAEASDDVRTKAVSLALETVEHILATQLSGSAGQTEINRTIDALPSLFSKKDIA